jgi:hypothetical protein
MAVGLCGLAAITEQSMYFVRLLSGRPQLIRDGATLKDPMRTVGMDEFTKFDNLPSGLSVGTEYGVEVCSFESEADCRKMTDQIAKSMAAAKIKASERRQRVMAKIKAQSAPAAEATKTALAEAAKMRAAHEEAAEKAAEAKAKKEKPKGKGGSSNRTS